MEEIEALIKTSSTRSLLISENPSKEFSGYVREVHIRYSNQVSISYEPNGTRAGGASFWTQYPTMAKAVRSVEEFLGIPVSEWKIPLSSTSFPKAQQIRYSSDSDFLIADAIEQNRIPLPSGAFRIISPGWRFYKKFKSEHSSKIDAAMEEPLATKTLPCRYSPLEGDPEKRE